MPAEAAPVHIMVPGEAQSLAAHSVHRPLMVHSLAGRVVPVRPSAVDHTSRRRVAPVASVGHNSVYLPGRLSGTGLTVRRWAAP